MIAKLTWRQALAWRMERQLLHPVGQGSVEDVVRRLGGVQAQVLSSAAMAVCVRSKGTRPEAVGRALAEGRLIKTWAMRGTLHLLTPEGGGAYLSLLASERWWDRPAFWRWYDIRPAQFEVIRETVQEVLDGAALTKDELAAAVTAKPGLEHVGDGIRESWGTLLKPLANLGDLCFGASRDGRVTFTRPSTASSRWTGVPDPEEAAPHVVAAYLGAYGPATLERMRSWFSQGRVSKRQLTAWFHGLGDRMTEVDVDGERAYLLAEHLDDVAATRPTNAVRLVPGFDQYLLGGGTDDIHVIPAARRRNVSRQSGWIAPSVIGGGVVRGTWSVAEDVIKVAWFREAGRLPTRQLEREVERLSAILARELRVDVSLN